MSLFGVLISLSRILLLHRFTSFSLKRHYFLNRNHIMQFTLSSPILYSLVISYEDVFLKFLYIFLCYFHGRFLFLFFQSFFKFIW